MKNKITKCENCGTGVTNFSSEINGDKIEHYYCSNCKSHYYKACWWNIIEWEKYLVGENIK